MADDRASGFSIYSLGIVVKSDIADPDNIEVTPIERVSMVNGLLKDFSKKFNVSLPDLQGIEQTAKLEGDAVLIAKWVPFGDSNRETAPNVQPSETVLLFTYADTQEFYWTTIFREPSLRRKERVVYAYSNMESGTKAYDPNSSYWVLIDTLNKRIRLHTSSNDGEPTDYDITINTKEGIFTLEDELGNKIELNSVNGKLTAVTKESIELTSKRITLNATEGVTVNGELSIEGDVKSSGRIIDQGGNTANHSH